MIGLLRKYLAKRLIPWKNGKRFQKDGDVSKKNQSDIL